MKAVFLLAACCTLSIITHGYANTWPVSLGKWWWEMVFSSDNLLTKNVSVEKEILAFRTSPKNICQKKPAIIWKEFLKQTHNISEDFIKKNMLDYDNKSLSDDEKIGFIMGWNGCFGGKKWSVDVIARYYLHNNSDQQISDETVWFSFFKDTYINSELTFGKTDIYILHDENDYPNNLRVLDGEVPLTTTDKFTIENHQQKETTYHSIKKLSTFWLTFDPQETKILTISYTVPLEQWWTTDALETSAVVDSYTKYDFSPIFRWKGWNIKDVYIAVLGDDKHILHSYETVIESWKSADFQEYFSSKWNRPIYLQHLKNVNTENNITDIRISFNNQQGLVENGICDIPPAISSNFLCPWIQEHSIDYEQIDKMRFFSNKDPQKVTIQDPSGNKKDYRVFDALK